MLTCVALDVKILDESRCPINIATSKNLKGNSREYVEDVLCDRRMEKEEEDNNCCDGSIHCFPFVHSITNEPEEKGHAYCEYRKQKINKEVNIDFLHCLVSFR